MPRRVSLPSADDLFRPTDDTVAPLAPGDPADRGDRGEQGDRADPGLSAAPGPAVRAVPDQPEPRGAGRRPSGRVRHDEKMTVYVTSEELLQVERARLSLRSGHGLAVDRGRLVREALALVLADLEARGAESALVRRLSEE